MQVLEKGGYIAEVVYMRLLQIRYHDSGFWPPTLRRDATSKTHYLTQQRSGFARDPAPTKINNLVRSGREKT